MERKSCVRCSTIKRIVTERNMHIHCILRDYTCSFKMAFGWSAAQKFRTPEYNEKNRYNGSRPVATGVPKKKKSVRK